MPLTRPRVSADTEHPRKPSLSSTEPDEGHVAEDVAQRSPVYPDAVEKDNNEEAETSSLATSTLSEYTTASHDMEKSTTSKSLTVGKHDRSLAIHNSLSNIRIRLQESSAASAGAQVVESLRRRVQGRKMRRNSKLLKQSNRTDTRETKSEDVSVCFIDEEKALVQEAVQRKPGVREKANQFLDHLGEVVEDHLGRDEGADANRLFFASARRK
jgi:hypothetical protein